MKKLVLISVLSALIIGCTQPPAIVTSPQPTKDSSYPVVVEQNDTITYTVNFPDEKKRTDFIYSFENFIKSNSFADMSKSTDNKLVHIKILPSENAEIMLPESIAEVNQSQFTEIPIGKATDTIQNNISETDTVVPEFGGSVRMYISHESITPTFSQLTSVYPFSIDEESTLSSTKPVFEIAGSNSRRVILKLQNGLKNANGRPLSALDIISAWTNFVKTHPVEGFALFRYVDGITEFIRGNEATIKGFGATDQNTIVLKMSQEDNEAVNRLKTHRLLVESLNLGAYYVNKTANNELFLLSNKFSETQKGFLEQLTLYTGGDGNPILSFSLNKYDAITISTINDLTYAKTNLLNNASLIELPSDRYFISCKIADIKARKFISSIVNPLTLLNSHVKEEGTVINTVCSDSTPESESISENTSLQTPSISKPLKILYRSDDNTSRIIAEKVLADLSAKQVPSKLVSTNVNDYEKAIASGNCDIITGWVSQSIVCDRSEQLRMAAIWFDDQIDENARIQEYKEIPLFKLNRYVLARKNISLYKKTISGIYTVSEKESNDSEETDDLELFLD